MSAGSRPVTGCVDSLPAGYRYSFLTTATPSDADELQDRFGEQPTDSTDIALTDAPVRVRSDPVAVAALPTYPPDDETMYDPTVAAAE
ncbi:hypothetical protein [Halonotius pteroides]|uniref:Uncharacterized protein n=1 Tax=Halonotius pteroides TaxID=268735 RepID=A0A3A6Q1S1_9EURY|nr:hypothetical protein [Halonotius pteroides]RJX51008.1 hypothetical protein DP106_02665 [Halonotius pteroides]